MKKLIIHHTLLLLFILSSYTASACVPTLEYRSKQSGDWSLASTWQTFDGCSWVNAAVAPSNTDSTITISTGYTVTVSVITFADQVIIVNGGTLIINGGPLDIDDGTGYDLSVYGTLIINSGTLEGTGQTEIGTGGHLTNNGSITLSSLAFTGALTRTLYGTGSINALMMNGGGGVALGGTQTINNSLNLSYGRLYMNNFDLIIGPAAVVGNGNISSYLVTNGTGACKRTVPNNALDVLFPVGIPVCYMPVTINLTLASTSDMFSVRMLENIYSSYDANNNPTSPVDSSHVVNASWIIAEATAGGSDATVTFQWNGIDETSTFNRSLSKLGEYTGGAWNFGTYAPASGTDPYTFSKSGITSFSPFGIIDTLSALNAPGGACWFYIDADGDGYGNPLIDTLVAGCIAPAGYVSNWFDCDDSNVHLHPGPETCGNGIDDNCDGNIDESTGMYIRFDENSSNVITAYQSNFTLQSTNQAFSIACWLKADSAKSLWNSYLIDKHGHANGGSGFVLREGYGYYSNAVLDFVMYDSAHVDQHIVAGTIYQGQWYYATATFDGISTMTLYLNGLPIGTTTAASFSPNTYDITIGGGTDSVPNTFAGSMDNVSVWDYALSPQNIIDAMKSDSANANGNVLFYNMETAGVMAGASNVGRTTVTNLANPGIYDGILSNFALAGTSSNYESDNLAWYMDLDADGYTVGAAVYACSKPSDGYIYTGILGTDCNDNNPAVHSASLVNLTYNMCLGSSVTIGTHTYNTTGIYTDTLVGSTTCDSIITTNLSINSTINITQNRMVCGGKSLIVGIHTYTSAGTYIDTLSAIGGCDSIITSNLTFNPVLSAHAIAPVSICYHDSAEFIASGTGGTGPLSYYWIDGSNFYYHDTVHVSPGATSSYTLVVTDSLSCFEGYVFSLIVNPATNISGYVSYQAAPVHGTVALYKWHSGYLYFDSIHNTALDAFGYYHFDTMIHNNYIVKVFPDNSFYPAQHLITTYYDSIASAAIWDGASVIHHSCLTNNDSVNVSMFAEDTIVAGTVGNIGGKIIEGNHYLHNPTQPVSGTDVKLSHGGLIIHSTTSDTAGNYQFDSIPLGTYTVQVDIPGCHRDSIYTVYVTSVQHNFDYLDYVADSADIYMPGCYVWHENIIQVANYLTVDSTGTNITYQWLDCGNGNSVIPSADSAVFTPTTDGSYAVYVTQNGCKVTSGCFAFVANGISGKMNDSGFSIYPNPFTSSTTITFNAEQKHTVVIITNVVGKEIKSIHLNGERKLIIEKGDMEAGVYFIEVQSEQGIVNRKMVVQ